MKWRARNSTSFDARQDFAMNGGADLFDVNDVFRCRDNRYVKLEAGPPYPKLLKGYLSFFDCGDNKASNALEVAE